jgi:hypothetical protein
MYMKMALISRYQSDGKHISRVAKKTLENSNAGIASSVQKPGNELKDQNIVVRFPTVTGDFYLL